MKEMAVELAKKWSINPYFDEQDKQEILDLLKDIDTNQDEIIDRFYKDLEFGTGGLRSIIGMGRNRINKYNVRKATQAMANAVLKLGEKNPSVAVSYDCRNYSIDFAKEVSSVFAANGITAHIYKQLTPTPMLSFAVRHFNCQAGVMVTASHNPKQYNGFKAYWGDGSQVTPPYDQNIIDEYSKIENWDDVKSIDFEKGLADKSINWIDDSVDEKFYDIVLKGTINPEMCKEHGHEAYFIYTPLNGCGNIPCQLISNRMGFDKFEVVQDQAAPDGNFTTITSTPNPEDPIALEEAVLLMKAMSADIAYATDPDCDRLGVVVNHHDKEHYLNGNQIAFLMLNYIFSQRKEKGTLPSNPLVIKSIVTSGLQNSIVEHFGGTVLDTLTGFKWMARLWKDLEDQGTDYNFVFASEESFGYMPNDEVRDKDAVASMALMNEIVLFYKLKGKTLIDALDEIYSQFGYAQESLIANTYEGLEGKAKIDRIMQYFRDNFSSDIASEQVATYNDYKTLLSKDLIESTEAPISMTSSNVLGFKFKSGNQLFLRPSGTEPKIKFYTMVKENDGDLVSKKKNAAEKIKEIESFLNTIIEKL